VKAGFDSQHLACRVRLCRKNRSNYKRQGTNLANVGILIIAAFVTAMLLVEKFAAALP